MSVPRAILGGRSSDELHDTDDDADEHEEDDGGLHPDPQRVHGGASLVAAPLTPRARALLGAVEREVSARLAELEGDAGAVAPRRTAPAEGPAPALLSALELAVAGLSREEVAGALDVADPEPVLDAVFGAGSAPGARLPRAA